MAARIARMLSLGLFATALLMSWGIPTTLAQEPSGNRLAPLDLDEMEANYALEPASFQEDFSSELPPGQVAHRDEEVVYEDEEIIYEDGDDFQSTQDYEYQVPSSNFWVRGDYLQWWTSGNPLPPLIMTSPNNVQPGVYGDANTSVLFGDSRANRDARSSYRTTLGYWSDADRCWGVEADFFDLGGASANFSMSSDGNTVLTRPYFDTQLGTQAVQLIAFPQGLFAFTGQVGSVSVNASDFFESVSVRFRRNLASRVRCVSEDICDLPDCRECSSRVAYGYGLRKSRLDMIVGYRYYRLNDNVNVDETVVLTETDGLNPVGTMFGIRDSFHATNEFNGGELGLLAEFDRGRWSMEFLAKLDLGSNRRTVLIDGSVATTQPGAATVTPQGGFLALPSNIGRYTRTEFAAIPQFGAELGYQVTHGMRVFAGYNVIYWARTARAGAHIDTNIDIDNFPPVTPGGGPEPQFISRDTAFWAQGMNLGVELRY